MSFSKKRTIEMVLMFLLLAGVLNPQLLAKGQQLPDKQGGQTQQGAATPHDLFSVSFPTEKDGWACGRWGTMLHTTDGGWTWTRQESGTDYTLTSISFVDPAHGFAVGDGGTILSTKDGGKTWTRQKSPVP
jgi:photosystem II stability/assembly factor-like uncharacterized protein